MLATQSQVPLAWTLPTSISRSSEPEDSVTVPSSVSRSMLAVEPCQRLPVLCDYAGAAVGVSLDVQPGVPRLVAVVGYQVRAAEPAEPVPPPRRCHLAT